MPRLVRGILLCKECRAHASLATYDACDTIEASYTTMNEDSQTPPELTSLSTIRLTEAERVGMRNLLQSHIAEHPLQPSFATGIASGISRGVEYAHAWVRPLALHPIPAALVLVLLMGAGTSYAAEGALPGDTLYPVKTQVNERIATAIAVTPEAKARVDAARVARRLAEADTLAASGALSTSTQAIVDEGIAQAADDFDASIAAASDTPSTLALRADVESDIHAHARALATAADERGAEMRVPVAIETSATAPAHVAHAREEETAAKKIAARPMSATLRMSESEASDTATTIPAAVESLESTVATTSTSTPQISENEGSSTRDERSRERPTRSLGEAVSAYRAALKAAQEHEALRIDVLREGDREPNASTDQSGQTSDN